MQATHSHASQNSSTRLSVRRQMASIDSTDHVSFVSLRPIVLLWAAKVIDRTIDCLYSMGLTLPLLVLIHSSQRAFYCMKCELHLPLPSLAAFRMILRPATHQRGPSRPPGRRPGARARGPCWAGAYPVAILQTRRAVSTLCRTRSQCGLRNPWPDTHRPTR